MSPIAPSRSLVRCACTLASGCTPSLARAALGAQPEFGSDSSGRRNVAAAAQAAPGGPAVRQDARRRRWWQLLRGGQARARRQPVWRNPASPRPGMIGLSIALIGAAWEAAAGRHPCSSACYSALAAEAASQTPAIAMMTCLQRSGACRRDPAAAPPPCKRAAAVLVDRPSWLLCAADRLIGSHSTVPCIAG